MDRPHRTERWGAGPIARAAGVSRGPHTLSLRHSRGAFV